MVTGKQVKQFLVGLGHKTVRVRTIPCKAKWIEAWIPFDADQPERNVLKCSQAPFSVELRQACLKVIYPNSPALHSQASAGNVGSLSLSMLPDQWEQVINAAKQTAAA